MFEKVFVSLKCNYFKYFSLAVLFMQLEENGIIQTNDNHNKWYENRQTFINFNGLNGHEFVQMLMWKILKKRTSKILRFNN